MVSIDRSVIICLGAATEVEALKKALTEAEGKAVKEQAAHKKPRARVGDITTGGKPALCSRVDPLKIRSPGRCKDDGASRGPKAQRRVKACKCKLT